MKNQQIKMICFGVRKIEKSFFINLNKNYGYNLTLEEEYLTQNNIEKVEGHNAVMVRANCDCLAENLLKMKKYGIKYLLTRTTGYNHIDLDKAHKLGIKIAYVPNYSPNSVSELALSLGVSFLRNLFYISNKTKQYNFKIDDYMFAKEIRNSVIGIIGTGRIGLETAKAWKGIGAKVLGYDIFPNVKYNSILKYTSLETLIKCSDLISLHCPYIKNKNYHMVNEEFLNKMKKGSFLINTARGELLDLKAVYKAIIIKQLKGVGLDVIENEQDIFFKDYQNQKILNNNLINKLLKLYPRIIITPHIASYTDIALENMIKITYENLNMLILNKECKNLI